LAAHLIPLDEYLATSYEPDREFVDGVLVERNLGTQLHSRSQVVVGSYLSRYRKSHRIEVFMSVRVGLDAGRYRVPDLLVLEKPYQGGKFVTDVPAVTVEIKSPDDTFDDIIDKSSSTKLSASATSSSWTPITAVPGSSSKTIFVFSPAIPFR